MFKAGPISSNFVINCSHFSKLTSSIHLGHHENSVIKNGGGCTKDTMDAADDDDDDDKDINDQDNVHR